MVKEAHVKAGTRQLTLSNLDKVLYRAANFTKGHAIHYYARVAPFILPHLRQRPLTLKRYPDGVHGDFFYEKDAPAFTPRWIRTFQVPRRDTSEPPIRYILANDTPTLIWLANLAALELHPFLHRAPEITCPTGVVFDLDPGEGMDILDCADVGFLVRDLLSRLGLESFPKVSGGKGLQLFVPLNLPVTYEVTQAFACASAELLAAQYPRQIVTEMGKTVRRGRVFIDWSQNAEHKTTVAVYSLRVKGERPTVSMPVQWEELHDARKRGKAALLVFGPDEALERLERHGDLYKPLLTRKQRIPEFFAAEARRRGGTDDQVPRSLEDYRTKRNFARTAEPRPRLPRRSAQGSKRRFVVQLHAASHLHFDLRLEASGVLKSWAIPKEIPLRKGQTVTAFPTEDHPLEYLEFEGIIPEGQYGGGTVLVWDIGTYEVIKGNYWRGYLKAYLSGMKLKGEWTLQKQAEAHDRARWLLAKTTANARIPKRREVSVLTGRTLEQIARDRSAVWQSDR